MSRRDAIIDEIEKEYGFECDVNFDSDALCDGDTCRSAECDCWDEFRNDVDNHLDELKRKKQLCGSMSIAELRQALFNADDQDAPVLIDGKAICEAWWNGDGYQITTMEAI